MAADYKFTFGPWNIHEGADPFGPTVRPTIEFATKLKDYKKLGFRRRAVPRRRRGSGHRRQIGGPDRRPRPPTIKKMLDDEGLFAEFVAPRLVGNAHGNRRRLHGQFARGPASGPTTARRRRSTWRTPWERS